MGTLIFGSGYISTPPGILKIVQIICCFIGVCVVSINTWHSSLITAYIVGTAFGITLSILLLILHLSKLGLNMHFLRFQSIPQIVLFIYLLIVSAVLLSKHYADRFMAGGALGIIASAAYLVDGVLLYKQSPLFA